MASCSLTSDYLIGCDVGSGGVFMDAYIIELPNVTALTEVSGTITAITKASGKIFRKYQLVQETASFDEAIVGNIQNGTLFYDQKGVVIINKQNVAVRNELFYLGSQRVIMVVRDNNAQWKLYGREEGMKLLDGSITTGTAKGDRNGYTLNFTGKEREPAPFVSADVIATLQT